MIIEMRFSKNSFGSFPSTRATPAVGRTSPSRLFTSVVFPAPFGPSSPKIAPRPTWNDTPVKACVGAPRSPR